MTADPGEREAARAMGAVVLAACIALLARDTGESMTRAATHVGRTAVLLTRAYKHAPRLVSGPENRTAPALRCGNRPGSWPDPG